MVCGAFISAHLLIRGKRKEKREKRCLEERGIEERIFLFPLSYFLFPQFGCPP